MTELSFFPPATFDALVGSYRRLLQANPGKAIRLSADSAAVLVKGRLMWASLDAQGCINPSTLIPIDEPATEGDSAAISACEIPELIIYCEAPNDALA